MNPVYVLAALSLGLFTIVLLQDFRAREAEKIADRALAEVAPRLGEGLTEAQVRNLLEIRMRELGATRLKDTGRVIAALKSKIANFKVPKKVDVVADLPRNTMGKVQKNLLREQHKQLPSLQTMFRLAGYLILL